MSDNLALMQGSGALLATDEILGVHVLRAKVQTGADGSANDVSQDNPLPVSVTGSLPSGNNHLGSVDVGALPGLTFGGALPEGTNEIGSVTVSSLPNVTIGSALPAGTNRLGDVGVDMLPPLPAGTNNIGSVDVASLPSVTIGTSLPAGSNRIGQVDVANLPNVTIGAALPVGSNRIGSVDVASLPALPAGTNGIGSVTVSSLPSVTIGAALPAGSNHVGEVSMATLPAGTNTLGAVNVKPATSGGLSTFRASGLATSGALVKGSTGQVFGWHLSNTGSVGAFVKLYNATSAPHSGTESMLTHFVPAGAAVSAEHTSGISFSNGIGVAASTGSGDADTGDPASGAVIANLFYK